MKSLLKNWIIDLILAIITLVIAILLLIPSVATKIVSIIVGALLIIFFIFVIVPKLKKIRSLGAEWVIWVIIEAVLIVVLAVLAIVNQQTSLDLGIITLQLSHIVGVVFVIEGIISIIRLCNRYKFAEYSPRRVEKYIAILLIIIGTYIFASINISNQTIAIIIAALCLVLTIIFLMAMVKYLPTKTTSKAKK